MNLLPTQELSLYQLIQGLDNSPQPLVVSPFTLRTLVGTFMDFAIEQELAATIWVKLPDTESWLDEIERYQQHFCTNLIYLCSTKPEKTSSSKKRSPSKIVPIQLKQSSSLKRESFLLLLSPQFSGVILAQWQTLKVQVKRSVVREQQPHLRMVCSFEPPVIERVLAGIRQGLAPGAKLANTITDTIPHSLVTDSNLAIPSATSPNSTLLTNLLLKQLQRTEAIDSNDTIPTRSEQITTKLKQSERFKDELIANLLRELRTPLTHMKTALSLLQSKRLKQNQRQVYVELLNRECDRQNSLIVGLLELIQLDSFPETKSKETVSLQDFVPGIVSTYQPLAAEKGISLGYTIPAGLPHVSSPTNWLRQIIIHLLNNSLKFTPANGQIQVQASVQNKKYVRLTFTDTGMGIASSDLAKIFNSFYRANNTNKDTTSAGLGLTIVKELLKRCGGSISVESRLGKGSTFKVLLPVQ